MAKHADSPSMPFDLLAISSDGSRLPRPCELATLARPVEPVLSRGKGKETSRSEPLTVGKAAKLSFLTSGRCPGSLFCNLQNSLDSALPPAR